MSIVQIREKIREVFWQRFTEVFVPAALLTVAVAFVILFFVR